MAKQEQHDIREYYILAANLDPDTAGDIAVLPIPFSAHVIRMSAVVQAVVTLTTSIKLLRNGVSLQINGLDAPITLLNSDPVGRTRIAEYSPLDPQNYMYEGEDGDAITDFAMLTINSSGETAAASYTFMITLRP